MTNFNTFLGAFKFWNYLINIEWPAELSHKEVIEQIEKILDPQLLQFELRGELNIANGGCRVVYTQRSIETNKEYLHYLLDFLVDLVEAYPSIVVLGGEFIQSLLTTDNSLPYFISFIVPNLLRDIELETNARMGADSTHFLCKRCLIRCSKHEIRLALGDVVKYHGCRICGQSRDVIEWEKSIIAVLDNNGIVQQFHQGEGMQENWFNRRSL